MFSGGQWIGVGLALTLVGNLSLAPMNKDLLSQQYMLRVHYEERAESPHTERTVRTVMELFLAEPRHNITVASAPGSALSSAVSRVTMLPR